MTGFGIDHDRPIDHSQNHGGVGHSSRSSLRLSDILHVIKLRKRYLVGLTIITIIGVIIGHVLYVPTFTAAGVAQLTEQKEQGGAAQLLLNDRLGGGGNGSEEEIAKYMRFINNDNFYLRVAENVKFSRHVHKVKLFDPKVLSLRNATFWRFWLATLVRDKAQQQELTKPVDVRQRPIEEVADLIRSMTKVEANEMAVQIVFKATTLDSFTSSFLANTLVTTFVDANTQLGQEELTEIQNFVNERIRETTESLRQNEKELVGLKKQYNIVASESEGHKVSGRLRDVENKLEAARIEYQENAKLLKFYKGQSEKEELAIKTDESSGTDLSERLLQVRNQRRELLEKGLDERDPKVAALSRQMADLAGQIRDVQQKRGDEGGSPVAPPIARIKLKKLANANDVLASKIATLEKAREELVSDMKEFPEAEQKVLNVQRRVELDYGVLSNLQKKLEEVEIQKLTYQAGLKVQQYAKQPGPDRQANIFLKLIFGILVSVFMGMSLALLLEILDTSVKHKGDMDSLAIGFLGEVPALKSEEIRKTIGATLCSLDQVVCVTSPVSPEAMSFTFIRARLESLRGLEGKPLKIFTVTSAEMGDGKSMVIANLAVSLAQIGRKVALLDCDLRKPSLHCYLEQPNNVGLVDLLTMNASLDQVVIKDVVKNLDFYPSGLIMGDPAEILGTDRLKLLLNYLRDEYDYILIDTPPINAVVDSAIISSMADKVILVASYRKTSRSDLLMAYQKILQISQKKVHGVLNRVEGTRNIISYYSYPYSAAKMTSSSASKDKKDVKTENKAENDFKELLKKKA